LTITKNHLDKVWIKYLKFLKNQRERFWNEGEQKVSPGKVPPKNTGGYPLLFADLVITKGKVITVDDNFSIAQAVAVKDGKLWLLEQTGR